MTILIGLHGKKKSGKTTFENVVRNVYPYNRVKFIAFADALKECCKFLACKNKDCFDSQQGKETVLSNVEVNLSDVCFDIVNFAFHYENCRQLNLTPFNCMVQLQQAIRKTFYVKDLAHGLYQRIDFGGITAGRLLQIMGTDICRDHIHPDLWVNIVKNKILPFFSLKDVILITDVREANEYEMIKSLQDVNVHLLRIQRPSGEMNGKPQTFRLLKEENEGDRLETHSSETALDDIPMHTVLNNGSLNEFHETVKKILVEICDLKI